MEIDLKDRGISGIISILFLLIAFFLLFFSLYSLSQSSVSYIQSSLQREVISQKSAELSKSVSGFYEYYSGTGTLVVNITNYFGEPAIISKLLVVYSNGSATVSNYLGVVIQTGKSVSITLGGLNSSPDSVIVALYTSSGAQAAVPLSRFMQSIPQTTTQVPPSLSLRENNVLLVEDFSSDPLSSGRISVVSGSWSWALGNLTVTPGGNSSLSGENIAYFNLPAYGFQGPLPSVVYVLTKVYQSSFQNSFADVVFLSSSSASSSLYTSGAYYQNKNNMWVALYKYTNGWNRLSSGNQIGTENPILLEAYLERGQGYVNTSALILSSTDSSTATYSDGSPLNISYIGVGSYNSQKTSFSFVYITKSRDPLFVYIAGIPGSYNIKIVGSDGNIYSAVYDSSTNMFKAYIFRDPSSFYPILKNALVLVYNGNVLVSSYYGDLWGGCVYSP